LDSLRRISAIVRSSFIGSFRNRVVLVLVLFGLMLSASSVLLGLLSQEQEIRMLSDLGLAAIELLALVVAVFMMGNLLLEEMESRTIYLILTRSVGRLEYLLGRFLGTLSSVFVCMLIMTAAHAALLLAKGWSPREDGGLFFLSVFLSFEKVALISALALFFSLVSSSAVVSLVFTFFVWILGHFAAELHFLAQEIHGAGLRLVFKAVYWIIPHFQYLNARDLWAAVGDRLPSFVAQGTLYCALYGAAVLALSLLAFRKKEF
jgi:ABC-type transport system involved in multi-copper enzyme maturation permease subunit